VPDSEAVYCSDGTGDVQVNGVTQYIISRPIYYHRC